MWWRAPWLQQRWTLLGLALFDASVLLGSYNLLFWRRFDRWAGITGSVATVVTIWLGTSYLAGRYSEQQNSEKSNIFRRICGSSFTTAVVLFAVVVVGSWG
ncbi:MAG: exopolysaccharide biosynthesis polyprenyl glycosylphosphotransferase, partial [Prochlorococcaceae cyanobacterium]